MAFCGPDLGEPSSQVPRGPREPWKVRCSKQRLSYEGDIVTVPSKLTAAQIEPGLPPEGLGASVALVDHLSGDLAWYFADPEPCLLPVAERPSELPRTKVHVESDD